MYEKEKNLSRLRKRMNFKKNNIILTASVSSERKKFAHILTFTLKKGLSKKKKKLNPNSFHSDEKRPQ